MPERKRMPETARKFIETGQVEASAEGGAGTKQPATDALRRELIGEEQAAEPSVRFTVDLPRSLHRRLDQLSTDSGKPKTELVRIMIRSALDNINY